MTMLCRAVTDPKDKQYRRPAGPCQYAATRDGFCRIHHPASRLPKLEKKAARLRRQLGETEKLIADLRATPLNPGNEETETTA